MRAQTTSIRPRVAGASRRAPTATAVHAAATVAGGRHASPARTAQERRRAQRAKARAHPPPHANIPGWSRSGMTVHPEIRSAECCILLPHTATPPFALPALASCPPPPEPHAPSAMLVLFETPAGFALFKMRKGAALKEADRTADFATPEKANEMVRTPVPSLCVSLSRAPAAAAAHAGTVSRSRMCWRKTPGAEKGRERGTRGAGKGGHHVLSGLRLSLFASPAVALVLCSAPRPAHRPLQCQCAAAVARVSSCLAACGCGRLFSACCARFPAGWPWPLTSWRRFFDRRSMRGAVERERERMPGRPCVSLALRSCVSVLFLCAASGFSPVPPTPPTFTPDLSVLSTLPLTFSLSLSLPSPGQAAKLCQV